MGEGVLKDKSYAFALRIIRLRKYLVEEQREFVLSKQILRSGTAIGALVREAEFGQSKADFAHKLSIALKEANETKYWLSLLSDGENITSKMYDSLLPDINELLRLLISSVKTAKRTVNSSAVKNEQ